jgi:hypothetical protein
MSLIKTNSVLLAFDNSYILNNKEFNFLPFIQTANLSTKIQNLDKKFIGTQNELSHQFLPPEVNLDISYIQRDDFYNEKLFGLFINAFESEQKSFFSNLMSSDFKNRNAFILTTPDIIDLSLQILDNGFNTNLITISLGNIYLNSYSFSYAAGQLPIVNTSFVSNKLKTSNLLLSDAKYHMQNWDNSQIALKRKRINYFTELTDQSLYNNIIYRMDYLLLAGTLDTASIPLTSLNNFSNGVISSMTFSINLNRNVAFSFENEISDLPIRKIPIPIVGTLTINGIVDNFNNSNLDLIYNSSNVFTTSITVGDLDPLKECNVHKIIFDNLRIDSFEYSTNINQRIEYSMECTFKITQDSGMRIINLKTFDKVLYDLWSSNAKNLSTSDSKDLKTLIDDMDDGY